jgi:hypothetical protein
MARPTIDVVSLGRCRRQIGNSDSKRSREEAMAVAEAVGGARAATASIGGLVPAVAAPPRSQF